MELLDQQRGAEREENRQRAGAAAAHAPADSVAAQREQRHADEVDAEHDGAATDAAHDRQQAAEDQPVRRIVGGVVEEGAEVGVEHVVAGTGIAAHGFRRAP